MVDGFAPASIVAPLATVAILCNALIAPLVFHERFTLFTGIVDSYCRFAAWHHVTQDLQLPKILPTFAQVSTLRRQDDGQMTLIR